MEENREPQQSASSLIYPPQYPPQQYPNYASAPPAKVSRWTRYRRTLRLVLRRLLYGLAIVGRAMRPYAAFIAIVVVLLGVLGWMSYMLWGPSETAPGFARADSLPPASAVENYIKGQQSYNADMMWEAYSTDYQSSLLQSGASKQTLQAQADTQRRRGLQYVHYDYIGGVKLNQGGSMYFYTIDLALQTQHASFPFVFTADADGKIVDVDSPFLRPSSSSSQ